MSNDIPTDRISSSTSLFSPNPTFLRSNGSGDPTKKSFIDQLLKVRFFDADVPPPSPTRAAPTNEPSSTTSRRKSEDRDRPEGEATDNSPSSNSTSVTPNAGLPILSTPLVAPSPSKNEKDRSNNHFNRDPKSAAIATDPRTQHETLAVGPATPANNLALGNDLAPQPIGPADHDAAQPNTHKPVAENVVASKESSPKDKPSTRSSATPNAKGTPSKTELASDTTSNGKNPTDPRAPTAAQNEKDPTSNKSAKTNNKTPAVDPQREVPDATETDSGAISTNRRAERLAELKKHRDKGSPEKEAPDSIDPPSPSIASTESTHGIAIAALSGLSPTASNAVDATTPSLAAATSGVGSTTTTTESLTSVQPIVNATATDSPTSSTTESPIVAAASITGAVGTEGGNVSQVNSVGTFVGGPVTPGNGGGSLVGGAQGATGTSITPYQEVKLVQRVLRGLEQLGDGGGQVRLRLHPPELGSLQLTVRIEGGQLNAQLDVESSTARDALLSNVHTLKERLADQGIKIDRFDVRIDPQPAGSSTNNSLYQNQHGTGQGRDQPTSRYAQQNNNRLTSTIAGGAPERAEPTWSRTKGSLDVTV